MYMCIYLHTIHQQVRDLISWMHDMITLFSVDEQAKSVSQAENMITRHNEHKVMFIHSTELFVWVIIHVQVQFGSNCTSNSRVIARGEAEYNLTIMCTIITELQVNICDCLLIT